MNRLNAPPDYRWTNDEVLYEKNESLLTGICIGLVLGYFIMFVLWAWLG